jgi:hypothetical protein
MYMYTYVYMYIYIDIGIRPNPPSDSMEEDMLDHPHTNIMMTKILASSTNIHNHDNDLLHSISRLGIFIYLYICI